MPVRMAPARFEITDDPSEVASIDVLSAPLERMGTLVGAALRLLASVAEEDPAFVAGAVHRSLPPLSQPLAWLPGAVPLGVGQVAIYARWVAGSHGRSFAGSAAGRTVLSRLVVPLCGEARALLEAPAASLYVPTLLDATGELCPEGGECPAGRGVGPVVDEANPRAQFINVFRTTPERQQRLLEATYAIMPVARAHDGYLRTALHRSLDGAKVANYGQYRHAAQIRAMYFHARTARAFGSLLFEDVTVPARVAGRPIAWKGRPVGTTPRLRCYTVERVVHGRDGAGA